MIKTNRSSTNLGNCLVIGGSGLLGRAIVDQLIQENYRVKVFDLVPPHNKNAESIIGDIRNPKAIESACENIDTIFQTAAEVWDPIKPKQAYFSTNIDGNLNVIKACIKLMR